MYFLSIIDGGKVSVWQAIVPESRWRCPGGFATVTQVLSCQSMLSGPDIKFMITLTLYSLPVALQ
jgi:hypothetical protein